MMFAPTFWRRLVVAMAGCLLLSGGQLPSARAEGLLQLFNVSYAEIARKMPELAEAGYGSLWLPPPTKGSGGLSVGYDMWDPFDLGQKDQRNTVRTRYGTEADLQHMMEVAHRFGIRVYFDNIMNHRAFDIPGFNETTPTGGEGQDELYPGMVPEDFHLRKTEDGFYRKWDNTRNWQSAWQVQNLGLSDLIDIAHETPNANFGRNEGDTHPKYSFVRDLERPGQYDKDKNGNTAYFGVLLDQARAELVAGGNANPTDEQIRLKARAYIVANRGPFVEDVGAYLIRAVRWKMDRTKADGLRLDAVKHVPDYFFGQMSGAGKDDSDAGYLGGVQRQFNRTRGFSDANHRDSVFNEKKGRDDAMVFGEHLGEPPGYGGYVDAGMRLVDNDLRSVLNNNFGNPGGTLEGLDQPGAGGFSATVGVTHANSHDNDFAALKEMQHAHYMFREGMGLIYSDGYYKAGTLGESGGAFPRHANTHFLGQFGDPRIPNILKLHNDFARGLQQGRWADRDYMAYERRDNRDKFGNTRNGTASEEITMVAMFNDNLAQGQARPITTSFPPGAYLYQYAEGPNGSFMGGFYKYAWELGSVVVPPGGYYLFGWRTPELSRLWPQSAITLYQTNTSTGQLQEVPRIRVTRKDGPDGDINFNPYNLSNRGYPAGVTPAPYTYQSTVPVIKAGNFTILARADGSAENIWLKLNGGIDLNDGGYLFDTDNNGTGDTLDSAKRDHPPGVFSDIWMGYEQPLFVERQFAEKFAAKNTVRCQIGSAGAETFIRTIGAGGTINDGPAAANDYSTDGGNQASWVYHDPEDDVGGISNPPKQFNESGSNIVIWAKSNEVGGGFKAFVYYTVDGSFPEGAGGIGRGTTRVAELDWKHNQVESENGTNVNRNWWGSVNIPKPAAGTTFSYKIGFYKTNASSQWPSGPGEVTRKKNMLTTFRVADFNPSTTVFFPHNDYARIPTLGQTYSNWPLATKTGLSEGFHVLRARAHLNRNPDTSAPLYQTFTQVFYYDAQTPTGSILWPAETDEKVGGSSYEIVIRTDMTVEDVWFHIEDSEAGNDDAITRQPNGNGAGFEPFTDSNRNGVRDSNEDYIDLNANGIYDISLVKSWGQATNVTSVNLANQKEWRFRYNNIPANGAATITIRLHEASSIRDIDLGSVAAHVTDIVRTIDTDGPDQRINIAWPQRDRDRVDDNYTMKVYFTKSLSWDISEEELRNRFTFYANGEAQDRTGWTFNYGDFGGGAFHELSIPLPNLYNDDPTYVHDLRVVHTLANSVQLEAVRKVIVEKSTKPFVRITRPSEVGSDGRQTEIVLPDRPGSDQLDYTVRVETSATVNDLTLAGQPSISLFEEPYTDTNNNGRWDDGEPSTDTNENGQWDPAEPLTDTNGNGRWDEGEVFTDTNGNNVWDPAESYTDLNGNGQFDPGEDFFDLNEDGVRNPAEPFEDLNGNEVRDGVKVTVNGNTKTWDYTWRITAPGNYLLTATATLNGQATSTVRNARVILRQITPTDDIQDNDDDNDGLIDNIETNRVDLPERQAETWSNGDVHIWRASGRTLPFSPDSDGDGLPDALEVGWRGASNPPTDPAADTNGDGVPNFIGDSDPPLYAVVEHHGSVPGVGSQNQGDDRTRQAAGSVTDPNNPDTDGDGIPDGIEDDNRNGWTDGDGKTLPLNAAKETFATHRPNAGDWPNNKIDSFETWTETSPTNPDSDGDGLQDGWGEDKNSNGFIDGDTNKNRVYDSGEEWSETNPLNRDTDGDGLPDGWEVDNHLDPLDNGTDNMRTATANDGNPINGADGDPDNDGFTNAQELASGTDPKSSNTVTPVTGEGSISIGNFTQWTHGDLLVLDEYNEGNSNGGADVYRSWNDTDNSRDIVAFSFRDGGDVAAGGDGRVYFRVDFLDLGVNAWQSEVDAYVVIDTGNPGAGEASIPNEIEITTDMKWEVVVGAYSQNFGTIFVDRNQALNTTTKFQNPVADGGVEARDFGGQNQIAWSSAYDAVEIAIERQHLRDAGWLGDPDSLNFQVFTTKPNTQAGGSGDLPGRNDIRDTIYDDWLASDWWRDQDNIILNGKLSNYFGRSGNNDRNKSAKVMLVAHGNQAIQPASVKQALLHNGATNAANLAGYVRMVQTHRTHNAPLTLHITPTLASGLQWARSTNSNVNTNSNLWPTNSFVTTNNGTAVTNQVVVPNNDGPSFNNEIRNLVQTNRIDLVGSSFSDHVPKYFLQDFNDENKALAEHFLDGIYGTNAASRQIFWPTERVLDSPSLDMIRNMGYTHVFADQMRHFVKWFGRSAALGTSGYRLNRVNDVTIIPIHDVASEYLDQVRDEGSSMPIRQLLSRRARSNVQDQVVVLWRDMGDFGNLTKANSYEANVRWLSSRPWIRVVTAQQIVDEEISYKGQDGNDYTTWGTEDRGTRTNLVQTAKDWVDWASGENYDHWYFGSARETGLRNETFGTGRPFGFSGDGVARDAWLAARSTTNSTNVSGLFNLAGTVIHAAMFQTAFHNTPDGSLDKFSTGAYIYPDNATNQTLAPFARHAQSQARFANVYARVKSWAETANASTLGSQELDVDLDGAAEYLLFNSRVFAIFEARGGRMTAAWLRDPQSKKVWQVAGNFASYSNTDNEDEGAVNATAYRTSGFKDWWVTGGNVASPGNSNAVNNVYTPAAVTGATGWQFTGNNGITKRITLDNAWTGNLTASYTLSGPNKLFVRFGLSPNLLDLMLRGQQGLTVEENSPTRAVLKNTSGNEEVRAWVQAPAVNHSAVDVATATTTRQRRNQAQTHQVEVELTGAGPHIITLGFDQGTDIQNPGDTVTEGIPDSWWEENDITGTDRVASADFDGDGMTNMQEYVFGTLPTDPSSRHQSSVERTAEGFRFNFDTANGRTYQPKVRRDLTSGNWDNLGSPIEGDGSPKSAVDSDAADRGFYRVEVTFPQ